MGVVCEWNADESRTNHMVYTEPVLGQFIMAVEDLLRGKSSAVTPESILDTPLTWNPSTGIPGEPQSLTDSFRFQHCVFAFETVPKAAYVDGNRLLQACDSGRVDSIVQEFWKQTGRWCTDSGWPGDHSSEGLRSEVLKVAEMRYLLIALPAPVSPPEPLFVCVVLNPSSDVKIGPCIGVFTLEVSAILGASPPIVARIRPDRRHQIVSSLDSKRLDAFASSVSAILNGEIRPELPQGHLIHSARYSRMLRFWGEQDDPFQMKSGWPDFDFHPKYLGVFPAE